VRYAIVIEKAKKNYAAYVPDLPGCVATAKTRRGVTSRIRQAIIMHIEGLREDGIAVPPPTTDVLNITVPQAPRPRRKAG